MFIISGYSMVAFFVLAIVFHLIKFNYEKEQMRGLFSSMVGIAVHAYFAYWVYTAITLLK